ncbi:hypothetical protein MXB_1111, partial [Myxobolus squamalis]
RIIHDLYHEHLVRPSFTTDFRLVSLINKTFADITRKIRICYEKASFVKNSFINDSISYNSTHQKLVETVVACIFKRIQEISSSIGRENKMYMDRLKCMDQASNEYFSIPMTEEPIEKLRSSTQELENIQIVESTNVQKIASSVQDINIIMHDLAYMVSNQGAVIDRVDHQILLASCQVEASLQKLTRMEKQMRFPKWKIFAAAVFIITLISILLSVYLRK